MRAANKSNDIIHAFAQCHRQSRHVEKNHRVQPGFWLTQTGKNTFMRRDVAMLACANLMQ